MIEAYDDEALERHIEEMREQAAYEEQIEAEYRALPPRPREHAPDDEEIRAERAR